MNRNPEYLSPKKFAQALGVGESTLKRWCDQGLVAVTRTAGGHRKIALREALRFVRDRRLPLASPGLLRVHAGDCNHASPLSDRASTMVHALLEPDEVVASEIVMGAFVSGHSIPQIGDQIFAPALREIGERWACGTVEVFEERRACEVAHHALRQLRGALPSVNTTAPRAIGCTVSSDHYSLATSLAELVLREIGYDARSLGTAIPLNSLARAVETLQPMLVWISVSHIADTSQFLADFPRVAQACRSVGSSLVIGGAALQSEVRQQLEYTAFGDTMLHLAEFASALLRPKRSQPSARPRTRQYQA